MRAVFIRHAESEANIGLACDDFALIAITDNGRQQAEALAHVWEEEPTPHRALALHDRMPKSTRQ